MAQLFLEGLNDLLREGIKDGAFPGAAYAVGTADKAWYGYVGNQTYDEGSKKIDENTLWDMASVSKVAGTTPAAMLAVDAGLLNIEDRVSHFLPDFLNGDKKYIKVRDLLLHTSGLPEYTNVTAMRTKEEVLKHIFGLKLKYETGTTAYSCLGFVTLQQVIEKAVSMPMDKWLQERLYKPLGMSKTGYRPSEADRPNCAPTEKIPAWVRKLEDERGFKRVQDKYMQGDVHDPVANVIGGVSGNAGLFSRPLDMALYAQMYLKKGQGIIKPDTIRIWTKRNSAKVTRALGWDTKSVEGSSGGTLFSLSSIGHTGYTGTVIWIDLDRQIFGVLFTNRVCPNDGNEKLMPMRPKFFDAVFRLLVKEG
jgi:CubicO group peptidase (beta-lactamase class C family)